ncbi:MAG: hypothetical protein LLG06_19805 [Desulfobacteraceae bacterium]|nr:hypothetical protein [Desulfobacteraceae bacterium]
MVETVIGGLLGGLFRLAPEIFKFLDAKNERAHELSMQDKAIQFQKLKGDQAVDEITAKGKAEFDLGAITALTEAIKGQETPSGVKWIDGFNKLIRPLMALQWVILLYPAVIVAGFILSVQNGTPALDAMLKAFGPEEKAFTSGIANFWILNRVLSK